MGVAPETNHVIATMGFLCWCSTGWTRRCVKFEIFHGSFVFLCELTSALSWSTQSELAVPALEASAAKSKSAILTDREEVTPCLVTCFGLRSVSSLFGFRFLITAFVLLEQMGRLLVFSRSRCTLTPLPRAIYGSLVRL